jgi:DNA helicase-2/ATP-dependent DNA helicase PcrA
MISAGRLSEVLQLPAPTPEQIAVIEAPLVPALVVAGAGSGKTETMAARVLYLVANDLVRPEQILGLTFTRKAAAGLAARIRKRLRALTAAGLDVPRGAPASAGEPEVSTYHSFGGRLIGEFGPLAGIEPASRVLSATGSWQLARRVVGRWDGDLETDLGPDQVTERLLAMSGGLADHLIDATTLADEIERVLVQLRSAPPSSAQKSLVHSGLAGYLKRLQDRAWILPLVDAFIHAKRQAGVVDFADQMQVAAGLATDHDRIGHALRDRHRVVLLDEYQDTGHAQRVILRAVFAGTRSDSRSFGHPVTAVGDPVQSIYSWRGASASNLPRFPSDFPNSDGTPAARLTLSTSFRNSASILGVANQLSAPVRTGAVEVLELRPRPGAAVGEVRYGLFCTAADEERWIAEQIACRWTARSGSTSTATSAEANPGSIGMSPPSTAVLMRRRRDMEPMAMALRAVGVPVEVVGLGGLLNEPEIADLLAMLRVLVDPTAGSAALRLLTGARWQLGMADLAALSSRASALTPRGRGISAPEPGGGGAEAGRASVRAAMVDAASGEEIDSASLIDALSDPGPPENYSPLGFRRVQRFAAELQRLRGRLSLPLGDLLAELERASGLDIEVCISSPAGRAHLDAFADVVADFAAGGGSPVELVDYLLTASEREDGLAPGEVAPMPGRVQVLTVHAAKGLEWEIVAVPHLSDTVFPGSRGSTWLGDAAQLPPSLRGDRADLPQLSLPVGGDQKDMVAALAAHSADLKAEAAVEERRLLYVAVTRAERTLLVSGHQWGRTGHKPHGPSEFLTQIRAAAEPSWVPDEWADPPADGEINPMTSTPRTALWPADPLGDRRDAIRDGADLVLAAISHRQAGDLPPADGEDHQDWSRDVAALLEERRSSRSTSIEVALPQSLSATTLVELADDPAALARRIRRPVPHAPAPRARRGTDFHAWLERFYTGAALLEISELPGARDNGPEPDADVELLKSRFQASDWSRRMPFEVELPFSMTIAGQPVRGRIDAVFRDDDGGCTVVDWKTGHRPSALRQAAATVQLAVYRLAVAEMMALPLGKVRAAFVYVERDTTFAPADLLDADGLAALIVTSTSGDTHVG